MKSKPTELTVTAPYGTWPSSLSSRWMSSGTSLIDPQWAGDTLVWLEQRPDRSAMTAWHPQHGFLDLSFEQPIRGGLFYGGGEFGCGKDRLVFVEKSGQLYRQSIRGGIPSPVGSGQGKTAAPTLSPDQSRVLFVHTLEDQDTLRCLDLYEPTHSWIIAQGADFYMQPAWHPDGKRIAWIEWDHPGMPWQGSRLMLVKLNSQHKTDGIAEQISGTDDIPVFQPAFSPDGRWLSYIENNGELDRVALYDLESGTKNYFCEDRVLLPPAWVQGLRVYGWLPDSSGIILVIMENGFSRLYRIDIRNGAMEEIDLSPYTYLAQPTVSVQTGAIAALVSSPNLPTRLVVFEGSHIRTIKTGMPETMNFGELPSARSVEWESPNGIVHGLYYPPTNSRFQSEGLPPILLHVHSGPTLQVNASFSADTAFFTSKGYAYLSVNYHGSTGYGRSYRDQLNGAWGDLDVQDTISAVEFIRQNGLGDPSRIVIKGSSAGGYTVLNCLVRYPGLFKAAICSYGVSNLFTVVEETFKFESHYYDSLIGTLPESESRFREWSPIFHAEMIQDPIILFHGSDDPVVPVDQTEEIVRKLVEGGIPHEYHRFEGEGHGWRKSETLADYYRNIEAFLNQHLFPTNR